MMRLLHAVWTGGSLRLWSERLPTDDAGPAETPASDQPHPFDLSHDELRELVSSIGVGDASSLPASETVLRLPGNPSGPSPSPPIAHAMGLPAEDSVSTSLSPWCVRSLDVPPERVNAVVDAVEEHVERREDAGDHSIGLGDSFRFYAVAARCVRRFVAAQRFVPNLLEDGVGGVRGVWLPWLSDEASLSTLGDLLDAMPPAARAAEDPFAHQRWPILQDCLKCLTDAMCRQTLVDQDFIEAIEDRGAEDPHVAWLSGLLGRDDDVRIDAEQRSRLVRGVREWLSRLDERGADSDWRLCLTLLEPIETDTVPEFGAPGRDVRWTLRFDLQSVERPDTVIDAAAVWEGPADVATIEGLRLESPQDLLLAELARASRIYPRIERALEQDAPDQIPLTTTQAYDFLREMRPLLLEQGFGVRAPAWWESPSARLGATLEVMSDEVMPDERFDMSSRSAERSNLGLEALVDYRWRLSIGDQSLSTEQFEELAQLNTPLVRVGGRWVEIRPEDLRAASEFLRENPGGATSIGGAMRLAFGLDASEHGLNVRGVHATGWAAQLLGDAAGERRVENIPQPESFVGELRPYQLNGLSWMVFLDSLGLGACLADDMGLGKTVQLLALLLQEREALADGESPGPTVVIAPLSVIMNWRREAERFAPRLRVLVHHGPERALGDDFVERARRADLVITTFALAHRDIETLARVPWRRIVLDEAQNVKNPSAKQTQSIMRLQSPRRIALTGTPVENRLSELWSIMNFCNEGYLGTLNDFRRRFSVPIERRHNKARSEQLRGLTRPFILRRLKSDPAVAADLPEKVESKEYSLLTPEQATLYEQAVSGMLTEVDRAEGMQRRGIVLATLIKLKQICNHPAQAMGESLSGETPHLARRSGKCLRLIEMLDELIAEGHQALIFTQFRQMGRLLASMLRHDLGREILFLHGGTPQGERQRMIDRFQEADGSSPVFILSLKAGGFGLNLTAASHVFHFDRWWNPAVENQATDRAHRIGQTRTVHVHKFIVAGTLEERIDQMIEQKSELSERIIGSGERWLTELSTSQLRDLLTLRTESVDDSDSMELAGAGMEGEG